MKIKLGSNVRDAVSGFTGTATQILEQLNGNIQVAIQPKMKEGDANLPEAMFIDQHMIEVIDAGVSDRTTKAPKSEIKLGWRVRDKASGFEGVAVAKATHMNGCVFFAVMPKVRTESLLGGNTDQSWIDHGRLEYVDQGLIEEAKPASEKRPGGPSQRAPRQVL